MSDDDRELYVHEVTAAAAPSARLLIVAAPPGGPVRFLRTRRLLRSSGDSRPRGPLLSTVDEKMAFANGSGYRNTPVALISQPIRRSLLPAAAHE